MFRYPLVLAAALAAAAPASAASSGVLFDEINHDFGSVPHGSVVDHSFTLFNKTGQPLHINNVRVSCGCTTAWAVKNDVAAGGQAEIMARMDTGRFYGVRKVTVYVQWDQPQWEEVALSVQANSRSDVTFSPQ
jgi:hypothetical protein